MTDDAGVFELKGLPAGRYFVAAQVPRDRPQYVSATYGGRGPYDRGKPIEVADGALIENILIAVRRTGIITGRVLNEFGEPVAWARVNALMVRPGGEPSANGPGRETDDLGRFRLFGLEPGQYVVSVDPEHWMPESSKVRYVSTFYPGVPSIEEAQPVTVDAAQDPADIELVLRRARTYRVSGTVVSTTGQSGRAQIGWSRGNRGETGTGTNPDGTFTIAGLTPGEYTFTASSQYFRDADAELEMSAPVKIQVDDDVDGLTLVMRRGVRISGHVVVDFQNDKRPASMRIMAAGPGLQLMYGPPPSAAVRPDNTFTLSNVFGPVVLRLGDMPVMSYNTSVFYKGKDVSDVPTEFGDVRDSKDVEVVVSDRGAQISGRVTDAKGAPVADGAVLAFPADERRWGMWSAGTRLVMINARGRFAMTMLKPGKYLLLAADMRMLVTTSAGPAGGETAMFAKLASIATPVELVENEVREVSLTVSKIPQ